MSIDENHGSVGQVEATRGNGDDVDDGKLQCCVIDNVAKNKTDFHVTVGNVSQISLKIWNRHGIVTGNSNKTILYHIEKESDVYNLTKPVVSKADLLLLLTNHLNGNNNDCPIIYLLTYDDSVCIPFQIQLSVVKHIIQCINETFNCYRLMD